MNPVYWFTEDCSTTLSCDLRILLQYFRYLRDEDDGVSEAVIDFAVQYVGILKVSSQSDQS